MAAHGQSAHLSACASSGCAWRLRAARHSQCEAWPLLRGRSFHCLWPCLSLTLTLALTRWRRIREQIAATAPDVIALQELDRAEDVQRDLAQMGYTMSYTPLGELPSLHDELHSLR